ncbi:MULTISPECIES: integrase domain-containing protein [Colwellia]|uniref:Integrase n=1 Tax=Colwellia marinimaniae TaxID=1513592 RepID=A0ABQ0MT28_9GAMM|nr:MULTISPECIES: integrase domain-containing protein [Colwellia]GAW95507.1 integrase [Colwellia marinimaniae]
MAKIISPLTSTEVKHAKPKEKEYNLADGNGLMLRIKPSGSKIWLFNYYRPFTKKRANLGFGQYPDVTLAKAREKRAEARALLADDIDPKDHKNQHAQAEKERLTNTLQTLYLTWFNVKKSEIKENTANEIKRMLDLHVMPKLGSIAISKLTAPMVIDIIKPISEKGKLETVKRICQRLNNIMIFALNTGVINNNPLSGINHAFEAPKVRNMPTLKPDELPKFMEDLKYASIKLTTLLLIEWQLHTITRAGEAAGAKWAEIDFTENVWVIPAERMKMKREHLIPLTDKTLDILARMKPLSGHKDYIFPSYNNPLTHTNPSTVNMAIKRMGYKDKLVGHGLRSLASTTLNEQGFDADVIEAALAHADKNEVRRIYNRADYLERRRKLMYWWSEHIEQAQIGKTTQKNNIINLKVQG